MIWLLLLGTVVVGLLQARHDGLAVRLAVVSVALTLALGVWHTLGGGMVAERALLVRIAGAPWGHVVPLLPRAHLAYPVLAAYAVIPLGLRASVLSLAVIGAAVATNAWMGAGWLDVVAGLALGTVLGWLSFDHAPDLGSPGASPARTSNARPDERIHREARVPTSRVAKES